MDSDGVFCATPVNPLQSRVNTRCLIGAPPTHRHRLHRLTENLEGDLMVALLPQGDATSLRQSHNFLLRGFRFAWRPNFHNQNRMSPSLVPRPSSPVPLRKRMDGIVGVVSSFASDDSELQNPLTFRRQLKTLLGICLGLQLLFDESEEMGRHEGLKLVRGKVVRFPEQNGIRIPHMGWNALRIRKREPLFANVPDKAMVYFVHSYFPVPDDASVIAATTEHGIEFVSAIALDNIFGTQFHPEKSSKIGLQILSNFVAL